MKPVAVFLTAIALGGCAGINTSRETPPPIVASSQLLPVVSMCPAYRSHGQNIVERNLAVDEAGDK